MTAMPATTNANKLPPRMIFAALCAVSLVLWFRPLLDTFSLALGDERYTHLLLILPFAVTLILVQRGRQGVEFRLGIWSGGLLLLFSVFLAGFARWRSAALVNSVIAGLQRGSVVAAESLFWLARTPVSRKGLVLTIPGLELEVAPECSSIRSSLMLIVTTMALAQIVLRSPWRKLLVVAVAIPLSVAKNGLRIFTIGWLAMRVDASFLDGRLHHHGGVVFFAIALAGIFVLLWILQRREADHIVSPRTSLAANQIEATPTAEP